MDWVPDLIGNPPRREENGGDQIQKTIGTEKRRVVIEIETAVEIETEIAVEIESQTQSFEIESGETEIDEIQSCETESCEKGETEIGELQIVRLEIESQIAQLEWFEQRLERWLHPHRGRPQRCRRRKR